MMRPHDAEYRYHRLDHHLDRVKHDLELLLEHGQISRADYDQAMENARVLHRTVSLAHTKWEREFMSHRDFRGGYDI